MDCGERSNIIDPTALPHGAKIEFREAAYFQRHTSLPSPSDVRAAALEQHLQQHSEAKILFERPLPVIFASQGLLVKYGGEITIAEGQCLWAIRQLRRDQVPVPEIYGWDSDDGQVFLYMELIPGVTLEERYPSLSHAEKAAASAQLRDIVKGIRTLRQVPDDAFIGHIAKQPLLDMLFISTGCPTAGPFTSIPPFLDFLADMAKPANKRCEGLPLDPFRSMLPDEGPITFTHNDLHRRNIIVSALGDGDIRIRALVDWHQSGWLPPFWEWCKAYWCVPQGDDWATYLRDVLEPFENFDYWSYFGTCMGTLESSLTFNHDMATFNNTRPIQLIVYHSRLFNAHWAILVPHSTNTSVCAKVHVTGTLAEGFEHEFQRAYDPTATGRGHSVFALGAVPEHAAASTLGSVDEEDTTTARNTLEQIALSVPAPGPSLRSVGGKNVRPIEVKDCQYWVRQYVDALVAAGLLDGAALDVLATAPQH